MNISLSVNGRPISADVEPRLLLVDFIRDTLGLTGTKSGCESGECGACTVLLDGKAVKSCHVLAVQADGAQVTTIEGLASNGKLHPIQEAFWEEHALQDGYATPGTILSVVELLRVIPSPTEAEIRRWLEGNPCRITGYHNVVRAIQSAAKKLAGERQPVDDATSENIVGASIKTKEAPSLLRGEAQFVADISLPEMLHAAILRSPHGHALIKSINTGVASAMPGVVRVFTAADAQGLMPLPVVWVPQDVESHFPPHPSGIVPGSQPVLAQDRVRFVGEQVAVVVAETRQQACDALDAIKVEYQPLPVVLDGEEAVKEGAPQLHDAVPNNLAFHAGYGDRAATEEAIANAEVVVKQRITNQRLIANTPETRGSIGQYDPTTGEYTLWTNVQPIYPVRLLISSYVLGIPYNKLRVIAPNIGGSMGSKGYLFPDAPLVLFIAKELGRPVKWVDTRTGFARSTVQGRDHVDYVTIAGTKDGKITALLCSGFSNIGAYPVINAPGQPRTLIGRSITGAYDIQNPFYEVSVVFTNTVQVGPLRGSGRAEAIYMIERMIDLYAREIGMDPAEVRRKNMVKPDQFPFQNRLGWTYDSGDYPATLDKALEMVDYSGFAAKKAEARHRGKRLGIGIGSYVVVAGVGPSAKMGQEGLVSGTWGTANLVVQPTGEVVLTTGAQPHGQSQETTFSQIVAQELGVPVETVQVRHSDTKGALFYGQASYGSRSMSVEGTAVYKATQMVKEKARTFAAHLFKANVDDVLFESGKVFLKYAPDKAMLPLQQAAFLMWLAWDLPEGMDPGLQATAYFNPKEFNFPFGTHVAVVEIDEATGKVDLVRYVAVNDFGNVVNPKVVDGQTHGNIAFGIGQALFEETIYDANGEILTDSYSTYPIPRATDMPAFELARTVTPTQSNPLGARGAGDVSNPPVAPAIVNAVCDALSDLGIRHIEMPLKPEKVWRAMQNARTARVGEEAR
jgi:aerobic carbon-monoxide dehydrogenase large subunit